MRGCCSSLVKRLSPGKGAPQAHGCSAPRHPPFSAGVCGQSSGSLPSHARSVGGTAVRPVGVSRQNTVVFLCSGFPDTSASVLPGAPCLAVGCHGETPSARLPGAATPRPPTARAPSALSTPHIPPDEPGRTRLGACGGKPRCPIPAQTPAHRHSPCGPALRRPGSGAVQTLGLLVWTGLVRLQVPLQLSRSSFRAQPCWLRGALGPSSLPVRTRLPVPV